MNDNLVSEVLTADTLPGTSEVITAEPVTERPLSGIKIGIDPGHQQNANYDMEAVAPGSSETKYKVNSGTDGTATSIPEYVTNLEISLLLRDKLEAQGATVYMTRETHDVDISNQERAIMMNEYGVDLALRIHCDSADDPNAHGLALYVSESNSIADQSYHYAEIILPIASGIMSAKANGIIQNDNYTGQNWSEVPCMMVECGFMSNPEEDILLNTPEYQEKICDGLTEGIIACFAP
ncbi:MAG: N-acetylmuramoyl-L-alanine amidase [Ruminococcus sp.]|nr:N-acetylmuramoyl-L-alanine amidase [Ruminococcus sp.]